MLDEIIIINPSQDDAKDIYKLIKNSKPLDLNSQYLYLLQTTYFSDTCLIAKYREKTMGFVSGFIHPKDNKIFFVWQIAVHNEFRGKNIAYTMLKRLLENQKLSNIQSIHTTISPSNIASQKVFKKLANELKLDTEISIFANKEDFEDSHEDELLYIFNKNEFKKDLHESI